MIDLSANPSALVGVCESATGAVVFVTSFHVLLCSLGRVLPESASPFAVAEVACKLVSSIFAVVTCTVGATVYLSCGHDLMWESRPEIRHYMWFTVFYFLYDIYAMFVVHGRREEEKGEEKFAQKVTSFWRKSWLLILHHLTLVFVFFPVLTIIFQTNFGGCLMGLGFLMEASTPFVSLRAVLSRLDMKSSFAYVCNGIAMVAVFFCCRILLIPYTYYQYGRQLGLPTLTTLLHRVPIMCNMFALLLFLPQIYWFGLMLSGVIRILKKRRRGDEKKD